MSDLEIPEEFEEIMISVEEDWGMGGLSEGLYAEFAWKCCKRFIEAQKTDDN